MRKGITPVVAIVLLLMMTVAAAGGAYRWYQGTVQAAQGRADDDLETEISVRHVGCGGGQATVTLSNTGSRDVVATTVDAYLSNSSGLVNTTSRDLSGTAITSPGGTTTVHLNFSERMFGGSMYEIELQFTDDDYTTTVSCTAPSQTCETYAADGMTANGTYWVDADGSGGAAPWQAQCVMPTGYTNLTYEFAVNTNVSVGIGGSNKCGDGAAYYGHLTMGQVDIGTWGSGTYQTELTYTSTATGTALTEAQEAALRDSTNEVHDATRPVAVSCDDDGNPSDTSPGHDFDTSVWWSSSGTSYLLSVGAQQDSNRLGFWIYDDSAANTLRTDTGNGFIGAAMRDHLPSNATLPDGVELDWSGSGSGYGAFSFEKGHVMVK